MQSYHIYARLNMNSRINAVPFHLFTRTLTTNPPTTSNTPTPTPKPRHSVVIGGGFVGLSTALHLQQIGRKVTLLESAPSIGGESSCSYGNAGTMARYANIPVNSPAVFRKLPGLLFDEEAPLSMVSLFGNVGMFWKMMPWAGLFAWNCRRSAVEHTAQSLGALLSHAETGWEPAFRQAGIDIDGTLNDGTKTQPWKVRNGYLLLQRTPQDMQSSQYSANLRQQHIQNLKMVALTSDEVLELEPTLDPERCQGGAWYFPDAWSITDPGALLKALADGFERGGGTVRTHSRVVEIQSLPNQSPWGDAMAVRLSALLDVQLAQAKGLEASNGNQPQANETSADSGGVCAVLDDGTSIPADEIIIAAGAHSAHLVSHSMDEFCPLDTERGYSISFDVNDTTDNTTTESSDTCGAIRNGISRAVCDPSAGWIASPMAGGTLRVAGKVELGGIDAPPTPARFDQLEREARALFTKTGAATLLPPRNKAKDWLGFRPTMPDALPVICASRDYPTAVFYAFGHQHIGFTLGGITGQLVAELVQRNGTDAAQTQSKQQQQQPLLDLSPYRLDRFHPFGEKDGQLTPKFSTLTHDP